MSATEMETVCIDHTAGVYTSLHVVHCISISTLSAINNSLHTRYVPTASRVNNKYIFTI